MKNSNLYFDIAATTPIDIKVAELIHKINIESYGNASSIHSIGQKSHNIIERARISIAKILHCKSSEIYFTSGGSESNNLVLKGILQPGDHFITSSYEHPSILGLINELKQNNIETSLVKPNHFGLIESNDIIKNIKSNTKLISIMYVNNELGTINNINDISKIATDNNVLFHSDAVQYVGKEKINLSNSTIDFLSIGAHKFYGPKGIGALFCKSGNNIKPLIDGGGQESGIRAGTENVSYIAGMSLALEIADSNYVTNKTHILNLEKYFIESLDDLKINYRINGKQRMPGIINITFFDVKGHNLLMSLDMKGIAISYGSACSSGSANAPLALLESGMEQKEASCSVRISIGKMITKENIDKLIFSLNKIINKL